MSILVPNGPMYARTHTCKEKVPCKKYARSLWSSCSNQANPNVAGSSRQGFNPAGESPAMIIVRFGHVAIPQFWKVTPSPLPPFTKRGMILSVISHRPTPNSRIALHWNAHSGTGVATRRRMRFPSAVQELQPVSMDRFPKQKIISYST
jgi:hypothetical protein